MRISYLGQVYEVTTEADLLLLILFLVRLDAMRVAA